MGRELTDKEINEILLEHDILENGDLNFDEFKLIFASEEEIEAAKFCKSPTLTKK